MPVNIVTNWSSLLQTASALTPRKSYSWKRSSNVLEINDFLIEDVITTCNPLTSASVSFICKNGQTQLSALKNQLIVKELQQVLLSYSIQLWIVLYWFQILILNKIPEFFRNSISQCNQNPSALIK